MASAMASACMAACEAGIPCFAMELEQDIALLEAEASRDELVTWRHPEYDTPARRGEAAKDAAAHGQDDQDMDQASDAESDDGSEDASDTEASRIMANARMVSVCGKPMQAGGWRGCCKSPWCDREDRHRGLCNHRATIPGPAACPTGAREDEEDDDEDDDEEEEQDGDNDVERGGKAGEVAAACHQQHSSMDAAASEEQQVSSGGHSHTCHIGLELCQPGDEREVASSLQQGDAKQHQQLQHQQSCASTQLLGCLQHPAAQLPCCCPEGAGGDDGAPAAHDLLWCSAAGGSQFGGGASGQLFALPAAYQPRVKDLTAPGSLLDELVEDASEALLCDDDGSGDGAAAAPLATHLQDAPAARPDASSPSSHSSSMSHDTTGAPAAAAAHKGLLPSGGSAAFSLPSSPSYASAASEAAVFHASFSKQGCTTTEACGGIATSVPAPDGGDHLPPAASSPAAADSGGTAAAPAAPAPAAAPAAAAAAAPAAPAPAAPVAAGTIKVTITKVTITAAAAVAAVAPLPPAPAAAAAAAATQSSSVSARPPRVRGKPSHSMAKAAAAAAVVEATTSPKSKKRPCSRFATNPSGGHCCTQCGAMSTPVWRAGPAGPKTLCNACGVRYMKVAKRK